MGFNVKKFESTSFTPRTAEIPVPDLSEFFGEGEKPVWKVRGLNGEELARAREAKSRGIAMDAIVKALSSAQQTEKAEAIRELVGIADNVPEDMAMRLDYLVYGSVEPKIDRSAAVKLFSAFPVVAYQLSNKVFELTGEGAQPGKPKASGNRKKSEPPSSSAT